MFYSYILLFSVAANHPSNCEIVSFKAICMYNKMNVQFLRMNLSNNTTIIEIIGLLGGANNLLWHYIKCQD